MLPILRVYWRHLRPLPHYWVPVLVLAPIGFVLSHYALAYIAAGVIDRLSRGAVPLGDVWTVFGTDILLFVGAIVLGELVVWRIVVWLTWSLEARMVKSLNAECFESLTRQSASFFGDRFVGSMVSAVGKFTASYAVAADAVVFNVVPLLVAIVVPVAVLGPQVPLFALGLLVVVLAFVVVNALGYRQLTRASQQEAEAQTEVGGRLADVLSNVLVVKSHAREEHEDMGFEAYIERSRLRTRHVLVRHTKRDLGFAVVLTSLMALTVTGILLAQATGVGVGTLVLMLTFSMSLFGSLWQIPMISRSYNRVVGDATPMVELLAVAPVVTDPVRPEPVRVTAGHVRLEGVSFAYPDAGRAVVEDLTLDIAPGERVGLVGPSGSGKTTLTRLVLRLVDPRTGAVRIDGQDVRAVAQQELRSRIAYVPQEPLLFHRSIAENIRYGRPQATDADVHAAAERAQVTPFTADLPDGLATLVGDRGVKLSGGQRQRIAIARAILSSAPILVLDEATSALDSLSEARIQTALDQAMAGRTTIAIAHRLSTLRSMTRLVVLDHGHLVEDGTHDTLLARGGLYASMWTQQSGGFLAG